MLTKICEFFFSNEIDFNKQAYFPTISQPEGLPLKVQDANGKDWMFQFRFWPNNNSRMYVLEGVTPCIQSMQLQAGDTGMIWTSIEQVIQFFLKHFQFEIMSKFNISMSLITVFSFFFLFENEKGSGASNGFMRMKSVRVIVVNRPSWTPLG